MNSNSRTQSQAQRNHYENYSHRQDYPHSHPLNRTHYFMPREINAVQRDIFIYREPPRVRHFRDYHERFVYGERVRREISRIYVAIVRFYNLVLDEYLRYHLHDDQLRRALHLILHETTLLLSRTTFAVTQFSITPSSWVATCRLNDHFVQVAIIHSDLCQALRNLRSTPNYQVAVWRNFRLFF